MADVNANIGVNIDTSDALSQLKALQRQISQFHQSVIKSSEAAATAQRNLQKNFLNSVNAIGAFSAELRTVRTTAETFTNSLEKNKFSMREYFRFAAASTRTFGRFFDSEFSIIEKTATERVKSLQTQYIKMGRDANGAMQAIAIRPTVLDMQDLGTQTQIAAQKQALFNQLVKQGSTNLLNFGKNTQWAGRQLMVGFTLPLITLGTAAGKTFMEMEEQVIKFRKVYGDLFTPNEERTRALKEIQALAQGFTQYGVAAADTVGVAAEAAAAGFQGVDLQRQTEQAIRLSVLGQVDYQKALETTISLQNAFQMSSADLGDAINFLNAVENQTVVSLDDVTTAIPKVAPVIQSLGGDVKDLAFFLSAMKEGGVNASEGANALKSGLASLINPTDKAAQFLGAMGINLRGIVEANEGDVRGVVVEFAKALDRLDPTARAQAIEQLFGKFQFARLSTLFDNVIRDGNQASRVLDLAESSLEDLAGMAESELGMTAESAMSKFRKAVEDLQLALVPIGEVLLNVARPILEFVTNLAEGFNKLPDGVKNAITTITVLIGGIGPVVLMTFGLLANGIANIIKFAQLLRVGYLKLTGQTQALGGQTEYLTMEQLEASAAAASLNQAHANLAQTFTVEKAAVDALRDSYTQALAAGAKFAQLNPNLMRGGVKPTGFSTGGFVSGSGNGDIIPAMLTPGEFVIKKDVAQQMLPFLELINSGKMPGFAMGGMVKGYQKGGQVKGFSNATIFTPESINTLMGGAGAGASMQDVTAYLKQAGSAAAGPLLAVMAREMGLKLNDPALLQEWQKAGGQLIQAATDALEKSGKEFINDDDLEAIVVPAMKEKAKEISIAGKEIAAALDNAVDEIRTVAPVGAKGGTQGGTGRVSLTGSYRSARRQAQKFAGTTNPEMFQTTERFSQSRGRIVKSFQTMNPATGQMEVATMAHIKRSITTTVEKMINMVKPYLGDQTARIVKAAGDGAVDGIKKETKQASPSKEAFDAGRNIGIGAIQGIESVEQDVKARKGSRRASSGGNIIFDERSQSYKNQAKFDQQEASRATALGRVTDMTVNKISGFSDKLMGATFAISSVAGVMSMFGGTVGEVAGAIMNVTGLLFALSTVTSGLIKTQMARNAISMFKGARGLGGLAAGGVAGARGVAKGLPAATSAIGKVGNVFKGLFQITTKVLGAFTKFIPIIGVLITGFQIFQAFQKQKEKVEALGNAANLSADKLNKLGERFNVTARDANFAGQFTAQQGSSAEQRSATQQLLEDQTFAEDFKSEIEAVGSMTRDQAEQTLAALAQQLAGSGFDTAAVDAIVNAIAIKAGQTDLNLSFAKIDFKTEEATAQFQNIAKSAAADFEAAFSQGGDFLDLFDAGRLAGAANAAGGQFTSLFQSLKTGFEGGLLSADEFNARLAELTGQLEGLSPEALARIIPEIAERLGISEQISGLTQIQDKLLMIEAATAGIVIPEEDLKTLEAASKAGADTETLQAASEIREKYNKLIAETAAETEKNNQIQLEQTEQQELYNQNYVQSIENLDSQIEQLKNETAAYEDLIAKGWPAAEAIKAVSDANFLAAYSAATNAAEQQAVIDKFREFQALLASSPVQAQKTSGGGGAAKKSPFQEAVEALKEQRKEIQNTLSAYSKLRGAGLSITAAFSAAKDPVLATALATTKVGTNKWKELLKLIKQVDVAAGKSKIRELLIEGAGEIDLKRRFMGILPILTRMGLEMEDIENILSDPQMAEAFIDDLKDGKINSKLIRDYIRQIPVKKKIELEFKLETDVGSFLDEMRDKAEEYFDILEREVEEKYENQIKQQEKLIAAAQDDIAALQEQISDEERIIEIQYDRPIAALQEESDDLSNDLAIIDQKSQSINEKYDGQKAALEQISKINQDIINQQKSQISLADALSQGDISAAAQIMQDMRGQSAEAAAGSIGDMLDAARQAELASLTGASGLTREQIEQRQFEISQQIYNLEEQKEIVLARIQKLQDDIYTIEETRLELAETTLKKLQDGRQAELDKIEEQRDAWDDVQLAIDKAEIAAGKYKDVIDLTNQFMKKVKDKWDGLTDKEIKLYIREVYIPATGGTGTGGTGTGGTGTGGTGTGGTTGTGTGNNTGTSGGTTRTYSAPYGAPRTTTTSNPTPQALRNAGATSGEANRFANIARNSFFGGFVGGTGNTDKIPYLLNPGEFVVNRTSTKALMPFLKSINGSKFPQQKIQDMMRPAVMPVPRPFPTAAQIQLPTFNIPQEKQMASVSSGPISNTTNQSNVYNYSLSVNVSNANNLNANDIANTVITKIRQIDSQRIRGQAVR